MSLLARCLVAQLIYETPDRFGDRRWDDSDAVAFTVTNDGQHIATIRANTHSIIVSALGRYVRDAARGQMPPDGKFERVEVPSVEGAKKILHPAYGPGIVLGRLWTNDPPALSFWADPDAVPKAVYKRLETQFNLDLMATEIDPFDGSTIGDAINAADDNPRV